MTDTGRHQVVLGSVERQLEELLDETAGGIGHQVTAYRSLIWQAKATVKAAADALRRVEG